MSSSDASGGTGGGSTPGPGGGGPGGGGGPVGSMGSGGSGISAATTSTGVAAKITHVKTATIDAGGGINIGGATTGGTGTIMTSGGGLSTAGGGAIKVSTTGLGVGAVATSIGGALNASQSTTATALRAIGAGGQSTQVRVVMPTGMGIQTSMIKQLEGAAAGRTQITAIPAAAATRTVPNTSITVTRPVTQTTYLPRASVTATQMTGMSMSMTTAGQRLVTPIRATSATGAVTGLTAAGSFVRGTAVSRNSSSPATTVISPATSTTWMATNTTGQVQLIRTIPHQQRQRIITTQGITANAAGGGVTVSGTVVATTPTASVQQISGAGQTQVQPTQSSIQTVSSQAGITTPHSQQQQTFVATLATVLPPPRQHQATLVYSSNVAATSQPLSQPQFNPSVATGQRFAVAAQLTAASGAAPRQIRPIPLGKSFSTTKLNTTSISIRAPNIPQLTPTLNTGGLAGSTVATGSANSPRNTTITGVATGAGCNIMPTTNLPTTRIIQLQQQPGGTTQQIIGSTGRLAGNVMLQPIIVNTSGSGKIGLRQPVTMATKVQPSLTITQLGRLPGTAGAGTGGLTQQNVAASIQSIQSGVNTSSPCISTASSSGGITATNLSTTATAQLVNVSQGAAGQLLTTQNIVSSASGATVVPLAITTRGGAGGNILTGTITPIKNANAITVGKVQMATASGDGGGANSNAPTNVYIHQTNSLAQRAHNLGGSNITSVGVGGATTVAVATSNATSAAGATTVLSSTGGGSSTTSAFLPPGSTIYYESVPASSVQVSTGVLSLTTTTVTSSTMSQNQIASSATSNLAISSLPFAPHAGNSTATFTVVPSSGGRTIGQLQIPVSSGGTQIQAVPVRFSAQLATSVGGGANSSADAITVSQATQQLISSAGQQILIPAPSHQGGVTTTTTLTGQQGQHMIIPLQTSIKVTSGGNPGSTTVVSNFLRKRESEGSPIRAAKNLGPTLLSMASGSGSTISSAAGSPAASSMGSTYSVASASSSSTTVSTLTTEALAKKDRAAAAAAATGAVTSTSRTSRPDSPASSEGSTTVSANSSPGVDQQMQDGGFSRMPPSANDATHFNPINDLYSNHHSVVHHNIINTPTSSRRAPIDHQQLHVSSSTQRLNGSAIDGPQRKRSRRSTNDSQLSTQSQASLTLPPPSIASNMSGISSNNSDVIAMMSGGVAGDSLHHHAAAVGTAGNGMLLAAAAAAAAATAHDGNSTPNNINHKTNNVPPPAGNKENAKPVEFVLRRPRNCTLLNSYKQSWKAANNHFQRYSDVKPREERRPTVIDLANQANIVGKINGWKVHHLRSQMEDLCENESLSYDKLSTMLKQMEAHEKNEETERVNELLKGNMQRSKIIVDGINEAQNQIMKIFEHKSHVNDIIQRCASKRNFKKREKL